MKLPFGWLPGSWGLKGKTRKIAQAEYELKGFELDEKITEIQHGDEPEIFEKEILKVQKKHRKISEYDYEVKLAEQTLVGTSLDVRKLEIDHQYGKLDEQQFTKLMATACNEAYVAVINSSYNHKQKLDGFEFEFDWNHIWIEQLIAHGYVGATEEIMVQQWFTDICRSVVLENADQEPVPFNSRRVVNRVARENGPTDYS